MKAQTTRSSVRGRPARRAGSVLAAATLACCLGAAAWAIIDPRFTPIDLVKQADTVLVGTLDAPAGETCAARWTEMLKGKAPAGATLNLATFKKDQADELAKLLAHNGKNPVVLFAGTFGGETRAFLSVDGTWLDAKSADARRWDLLGFSPKMSATFSGGTDVLLRTVRYALANADATCPAGVGTSWMDVCRVAQADDVTGIAAVELKPDRVMHLFVASPAGDRLFRPKKGEEAFDDVTAAAKLDTRSKQFAWVDWNRDGLADLVTWDGSAITVRLLKADGTFAPADPARTFKMPGECLGLAPVSITGDGAPAVLVSTGSYPFVLDAQMKRTDLPVPPLDRRLGKPGRCIVADLNNDGFVDVLQPREGDGLFWKGKAGGFAAGVNSPVAGGPDVRTAVGDFDGDGYLDIFASDAKENRLFENDRAAGFTDVTAGAGSLGYKNPPGCSDCLGVDLNHDGRPDLALCYAEKGFIYHFNRGFRCFGEEGDLRLAVSEEEALKEGVGVKCCVAADFNADGSLDLAAAFSSGVVRVFYNDLSEQPGVYVRLKKGDTGPVTVSAWQGGKDPFCVGTWSVSGFSPPQFVSVRRAGDVTLKFALPGKPAQGVTVKAATAPAEVVIGE